MSLRRVAASAGVLAGLLLGAFALAAPSIAAPYSNPTTISGSTQSGVEGGTVGVSGTGFLANETIDFVLHSDPVDLGTTKADASGSFSATLTLPDGVTGNHTIVATGETSGRTASFPITISAPGSATGTTGGGSGGGGLPVTGAAVLGVGGLGALLLVGGGVMLLIGKRQKVNG